MSQFNYKNILTKFQSVNENVLFKNAKVLDPSENLNAILNIVIHNGKISEISSTPPSGFDGDVIDAQGCMLLPGFFDMHVHLREPGREDEETILTGSFAAANGGYTGVACMPNTEPAIDTQEVVNFIKEQATDSLVDIYPIGAITKGRNGEVLAPIAELVEAGAVAISDDGSPVMSAEIMRRALEYSKMFDIPVLGHEEDVNLSKNRHMHEGFYSTKLGIPGIPSLSEEILVARDIMLTEFTGGKFHVCHISTAGSVDLVRKAKAKGLKVTCEVTPHHFVLTDKQVESFDTSTKMNPPLRSQEDVGAIIEGLRDGTIDSIATDHAPHSIEEKESEFIDAPFGITGLESALGLIISELYGKNILTFEEIYKRCVVNPRKILNLSVPKVKKGEKANLTLFNPEKLWKFGDSQKYSKSVNSPFGDFELKGKSIVVLNNGKIFKSS